MSKYSTQDQQPGGLPRQAFLKKGAAVAGAGGLLAVSGSKLSRIALGAGQQSRDAAQTAGFSFVQISDTHVGFHQAANKNVTGTFEQVIQRINALPQRPAFVVHTGDHVHLSKPEEFDT